MYDSQIHTYKLVFINKITHNSSPYQMDITTIKILLHVFCVLVFTLILNMNGSYYI